MRVWIWICTLLVIFSHWGSANTFHYQNVVNHANQERLKNLYTMAMAGDKRKGKSFNLAASLGKFLANEQKVNKRVGL